MYSKEIPQKCAYCQFSKRIPGGDEYLCDKKGIVSLDHRCRRFKYNIFARPVKRIKGFKENDFKPEDFAL